MNAKQVVFSPFYSLIVLGKPRSKMHSHWASIQPKHFVESFLLSLDSCTTNSWTWCFGSKNSANIFYPCYIFFLVRSDVLLSLGIFWILILSSVIFLNTSVFLSTANAPSLPFLSLPKPLTQTFNQARSRTDPLCISLPGWQRFFDKYFWEL